eukprot:6490482-Amphidinium_carterae.2
MKKRFQSKAYRDSGNLSAGLSDALLPYESARLDGKGAEGIHRDVQLTLNRSSGSKFAYWASSLRLKQNLRIWEELELENSQAKVERFLTIFAEPSRILSDNWTPSRLPKPKRLRRAELLKLVYRLFPHNMVDLSFLVPTAMGPKANAARKLLTDLDATMWDLFQRTFKLEGIFSWSEGALGTNSLHDISTTTVVKVVLSDVSRKKVPHSEMKQMQLPVYIQRYDIVLEGSTSTELLVRPAGTPELVEGMTLVRQQVVRQRMILWQAVDSHHGVGNVDKLRSGVSVGQVFQNLSDREKPLIYLLHALRSREWHAHSNPPASHDASTAKHFSNVGFSKRRSYLRCLLDLETVLQVVPTLCASQHERYYECVLSGFNPGLNKLVRVYDQQLRDAGFEPESRCDEPPAALIAHWEDDSWGAVDEEGDDEQLATDVDNELASAEDPPPAIHPELESGTYPTEFDGLRISQDQHAGYTRLMITCRHNHDTHKAELACRKYRNVGRKQTENFGRLEPVAYLGAWSRTAERFDDRDSHVAYVPSIAEVRAVAREMGL